MSRRIIEALSVDPVMRHVIKRVGPFRLKPEGLPPFESLTVAIISQQLSGAAARTIRGRFLDLFPGSEFPTPRQVLRKSVRELRSVGLSEQKVSYILDLAERTEKRKVPTLQRCKKMSDEELIECLTEVHGVGRWTVEMLLIFNLGRKDVLPVDDLGVRKGFKVAYGKRELPSPKRLLKLGEVWAPYRSAASWYLWRVADLEKVGEW